MTYNPVSKKINPSLAANLGMERTRSWEKRRVNSKGKLQ
jgi:hypothetical protein